jgi:multidrug transporter EmrE-like cation transporter
MNLLLSVLAAGSYTVGGLFMRKAEGFSHALPTAMVFVCFCAGATLQTLAMRRSELSINYILVLGLEAGLAVLLGVTWLGEAPSPLKLAGLALILAGVLSLRLEERPQGSAPTAAGAPATVVSAPAPEEAVRWGGTTPNTPRRRSLASRRPCQNTNHAPCP